MIRHRFTLELFLFALAVSRPCQAADDAESVTAVRLASQQYVAALKRGDRETAAAFWTPQGDLIDAAGRAAKGRDLAREIQPAAATAAAGPVLTVDSLRLITPDVAIEDGRTQWTGAAGSEAAVMRFSAVWVRQSGKWLLDSVRESAVDPNSHEARLQSLDWLVGKWVGAGDGPAIEVDCQWSLDRHFLLREIRTQSPEGPLTVSQRIGWDPASRQIKSWTFDSHGGHGLGTWSGDGQQWTIAAKGVLPDGRQAASRNILVRDGADALRWETVEHTIDGGPGPVHKLRLVRQSGK